MCFNSKLEVELTVAHSAKQNDVPKVQHFTNVALCVYHSAWRQVKSKFERLDLATICNTFLKPL